MTYYEHQSFRLATSQVLNIHQPDMTIDPDRYFRFVNELPDFRKNYLRHQTAEPAACRAQLERFNGGERWALMGEMDGEIVASGTLERQPFEWTHHVAEMRCTVAPTSTHLGIGRIMMHQLVVLAARLGIEKLYVEVQREHRGAQQKLRAEGFAPEAVRPQYVRDVSGKLHDVLIMSMDMNNIWQDYEDMVHELDFHYSSGM